MPLGRDFRADFSVDRLASDVYASTTSFRYEFPTTAEKRRRRPLLRAERVQAMNDLEALRDQCITICVQGEIPLVD